jgi:hypothetical protein
MRGTLERLQHVIAQIHRFAEILQPQCMRRDRLVAEEVGGATRGDHEVVVGQALAAVERHFALVEVHTGHIAHVHVHVVGVAEHLAQRCRDLGRRQEATRYLVEQRCEQVVVVAIDDRDVERFAREPPSALQTTEAGAQHDHTRHSPPHVGVGGQRATPRRGCGR